MNEIPADAREVYLNESGEPIAYCPKEGIGAVDLVRAEFYGLNRERMLALLSRAREKGPDFVALCIDVDDPTWGELVSFLMPGHDWDAYRERGERPVARGVVPREIVIEMMTHVYPASLPAPEGNFQAIFAAGGISTIAG